jgi:hypothetical protein
VRIAAVVIPRGVALRHPDGIVLLGVMATSLAAPVVVAVVADSRLLHSRPVPDRSLVAGSLDVRSGGRLRDGH